MQLTKASPATSSGPTTGSIANGVLTVTLDEYTASQGDATIRNAVTAAINSEFGVSRPDALANHVMYCMPPGAMSGIAYGYIDWWLTVYNDYVSHLRSMLQGSKARLCSRKTHLAFCTLKYFQWCNRVSAQVHELGKH